MTGLREDSTAFAEQTANEAKNNKNKNQKLYDGSFQKESMSTQGKVNEPEIAEAFQH